MNIKEQKTELNKKDIYENVRKDATAVASRAMRDINRRQTVHSNKSTNYRIGTPKMTDKRKKVYSSYDHYIRASHLTSNLSCPSFPVLPFFLGNDWKSCDNMVKTSENDEKIIGNHANIH